jgi:hypothetical protein
MHIPNQNGINGKESGDNKMISIELFVTLAVVAGVLALYGLMDMRNRFYANIAALFMASMITWYLSITIGNGTLQSGTIVNQTTGITSPIVMQDAGLGWLILIPAVAAMIATAYLIYDAYQESDRDKAEKEREEMF